MLVLAAFFLRRDALLFIAPFPRIVWSVDELRRYVQRRAAGKPASAQRRYTDDAARAGT